MKVRDGERYRRTDASPGITLMQTLLAVRRVTLAVVAFIAQSICPPAASMVIPSKRYGIRL